MRLILLCFQHFTCFFSPHFDFCNVGCFLQFCCLVEKLGMTSSEIVATPFGIISLWGGFCDKETSTEKRLEINFAHPITAAAKVWSSVFAILDRGDVSIGRDNGTLSFLSAAAMMIVTRSKVVLLGGSDCKMHESVAKIVKILRDESSRINWLMFSKKSSICFWDERDASIAAECSTFAELCPGHAFLLGPIDADHYFCYVHDSIDRAIPSVESDVQVNLVMYGASHDCDHPLPWARAPQQYTEFIGKEGYSYIGTSGAPGAYFLLRAQSQVVFFETNTEDAVEYTSNLKMLVAKCKPSRFSLFILLDPHSEPSKRDASHSQLVFPSFRIDSKTVNECTPGYVATRLNFVRAS